jgi:hypothetical protein
MSSIEIHEAFNRQHKLSENKNVVIYLLFKEPEISIPVPARPVA